jgi:hypothetical protein
LSSRFSPPQRRGGSRHPVFHLADEAPAERPADRPCEATGLKHGSATPRALLPKHLQPCVSPTTRKICFEALIRVSCLLSHSPSHKNRLRNIKQTQERHPTTTTHEFDPTNDNDKARFLTPLNTSNKTILALKDLPDEFMGNALRLHVLK